MFKRGKDAQLGRFRELRDRARTLPAHPIIGEYEGALAAIEAI